MDDAVAVDTAPLADVISSQFTALEAMLSRPVVQWQVLAIVLVLVLAWLIPEAIRRWPVRKASSRVLLESHPRWRRWLAGLGQVVGPIVALLLLSAAEWLFASRGYPTGLLQRAGGLIWLWLIYRALLSVLYARFGSAVRPYQRRLLTPVFALLVVWQILNIIPGFTAFGGVTLTFGGLAFTLGGVISAVLLLYLFLVGAWVLERALNHSLPQRLHAEPSVIASIATLARYAVSGLGVVVAFGALGFDATSLAIVAGGLSVGIGIGLQDIVANFMSGLILLFEQSLRPGDVIEIGGRLSRVEKISLRATTVRTLNNVELVIPNATFTTGEVTTLTKTEPLVRALLPLGVSYHSDPQEVRQIIEHTAALHPMVLPDPAPQLLFRGYGDSSLDFELSVWINEPMRMSHIKSDLYFMMWDALAEHAIEIPFPQRDLNLRGDWEGLLDGSRSHQDAAE
jgi:small-conductance mechanosensitive channel